MKLLIVVHHRFELWNVPSWLPNRLRADFPQIKTVHLSDYENINKELANTEILIAWSLRLGQVRVATQLRWIHSPVAAVHLLMTPDLLASNVVVTNARAINGPVVAEHVIAQIFALAKCLPEAVRLQAQHQWGQDAIWERRPLEVAGTTLGLVGVGAIGAEVAHRAAVLGMRVLAVREDLSKPKPQSVDQIFGVEQVDDLLSVSDYVVLCAPVTPSTQALINADRLARMKPASCLINVGRGPLIDDAALVDALRSGRIRGAALDVFPKEPLPDDSPYWTLPNVLITPHTAALTERFWDRQYELLHENLNRYLSGQPLLGLVDKRKGY